MAPKLSSVFKMNEGLAHDLGYEGVDDVIERYNMGEISVVEAVGLLYDLSVEHDPKKWNEADMKPFREFDKEIRPAFEKMLQKLVAKKSGGFVS
jgi:hypothetical protein